VAARRWRASWQQSRTGSAVRRVGCRLSRIWHGSRLRDAAGRPVGAIQPGRTGALAGRTASLAAAASARVHAGYLTAAPGSRAANWTGRVAGYVSGYPLAAAGLALAAVPAGYFVAQLLLLPVFPWLRWLDLGGANLGPTGLGRPVSPAFWGAVFVVGLSLAAVGQWGWPQGLNLTTLRRGSWFAATAERLLYVERAEPGERGAERPPGGPGAAGPAARHIAAGALAAVSAGAVTGAVLYAFPVVSTVKAVAAAAGLGLLLFSTEWYLVAVAAAAPFLTSELLVVALLGGSLSLVLRKLTAPGKVGSAANPAAGPLIMLSAVFVFAAVSSVTLRGSVPDLAANGAALLFVLAMVAVSNRPGVPLRLAAGAAAGVGLQGLLGLYQYAAGIPAEKAWVDPAQAAYLKVRVLGTFGNPNVFAEYLVLLLPLAVGLFFAARRLFDRVPWLGISVAGALALVLTFSRGGWAGLGVAAVVFAIFYDRRLAVLMLVAAVVVVSLPAGQNLVLRRLQSIVTPGDSSSFYRLAVWGETVDMIRDFWLSGVGLGHRAYMLLYPQYMHDRTKRPFHAHNTYLELLAETGILGLLAFAWLVWRLFRTSLASLRALARRPAGDHSAGALRALTAGGLAALAGALVHGMVEPLLYIPRVTFTFWFVVGVLLCLSKVSHEVRPAGAVAGGAS